MKVLITGASGFVGSQVSALLQASGLEVVQLSRKSFEPQTITWDNFFANPIHADVWIHLAGKAHDVHGKVDAIAYDRDNYELTRKLFDVFCQSDGKIFIFMSSVKAVADNVVDVLRETDKQDPKTAYGFSKWKAEQYITKNQPNDKQVYVLRPCMIHGPGNKGNLNLLYSVVKRGIPWPLGAFENKRSFLSIDNLHFVLNEILLGNLPQGVYNLADSEPVSTNDLIRLIAKETGWRPIVWRVPKSIILWLAKLGDFLKLPLNTERLHKLTDNYVVSNQKLINALGKLLPVSAHDGLKRTIKSFK